MTEIYEFIDGEKGSYPVIAMCGWMGVSRSGFYEWRDKPISATVERRETLKQRIEKVFDASRRTYGYRRVHAALARDGIQAGAELVRSLMRDLGLVPRQPRPRWSTTVADPHAADTPDLVNRDFTADVPGRKLVGDITYIPTDEGWLYLATVIDCCTRRVIGWATADHQKASLVRAAIINAQRNITLESEVVFHSDRGVQYTSTDFRKHLRDHGITPSVGRTGVCWDNALAESFFATIKNELVHGTTFPTRVDAHRAISAYIELFYNHTRLHSTLGYITPNEAHNRYQHGKPAA